MSFQKILVEQFVPARNVKLIPWGVRAMDTSSGAFTFGVSSKDVGKQYLEPRFDVSPVVHCEQLVWASAGCSQPAGHSVQVLSLFVLKVPGGQGTSNVLLSPILCPPLAALHDVEF